MKQVKIYKDLDFNNIIEYFDYIIDSIINGNFSQAVRLYKKLNKDNKKAFYFHCTEMDYLESYNYIIKEV